MSAAKRKMGLNTRQEVFFELLRAGLWGKEARLSKFKNIDYASIMDLAEEQSAVGMITAGMDRVVDVKIPQEELLQFVGSTLQIEQRNREMNSFLVNLIDNLRKKQVFALLVKGQGIAQCYEKPLWRACGDIDLLLDVENYEKAKVVLKPLAQEVEPEHATLKHQGLIINGEIVELHGYLHTRLSRRIDNCIDKIQNECLGKGQVRAWNCEGTDVFLPSVDNDIIFVFTHFLKHFYKGGLGLRQICDWCRLLWTYRNGVDVILLEKRLKQMGLKSEWKAFAAYAVDYLGMPREAMPLYDASGRWKRKAGRIQSFILMSGNFGHNRDRSYRKYPFVIRKIYSMWRRIGDLARHAVIFPLDSFRFFPNLMAGGIWSAINGEG